MELCGSCQKWKGNWCQTFCLPASAVTLENNGAMQQVHLKNNPEFSDRQKKSWHMWLSWDFGRAPHKNDDPSFSLSFMRPIFFLPWSWKESLVGSSTVLLSSLFSKETACDRRGKVSSNEWVLQSFRVGALNAQDEARISVLLDTVALTLLTDFSKSTCRFVWCW